MKNENNDARNTETAKPLRATYNSDAIDIVNTIGSTNGSDTANYANTTDADTTDATDATDIIDADTTDASDGTGSTDSADAGDTAGTIDTIDTAGSAHPGDTVDTTAATSGTAIDTTGTAVTAVTAGANDTVGTNGSTDTTDTIDTVCGADAGDTAVTDAVRATGTAGTTDTATTTGIARTASITKSTDLADDLLSDEVPLDAIRLDGGTQSRAVMDNGVIAEYTQLIREGTTLPPLVVYFDAVHFWLADGFHRYHAYRAANVDEVVAEIRTGSRRDAVLFSVGANNAHGLHRTNADKRHAVSTLLADAEWATWTDNQIAKACSVSNHLVADVKASLTWNSPSDASPSGRTYTTKHGTTATMNTANIGKSTPALALPSINIPAPEPATTAAELIPAIADTPEETATVVPSGADLAALLAENSVLRDELDDLKASFAATLADNKAMGRVFDADDQFKTAMEENKRLRDVVDSAERTLIAKSDECAEAIRSTKYWMNRAEKLEKLNKVSA